MLMCCHVNTVISEQNETELSGPTDKPVSYQDHCQGQTKTGTQALFQFET